MAEGVRRIEDRDLGLVIHPGRSLRSNWNRSVGFLFCSVSEGSLDLENLLLLLLPLSVLSLVFAVREAALLSLSVGDGAAEDAENIDRDDSREDVREADQKLKRSSDRRGILPRLGVMAESDYAGRKPEIALGSSNWSPQNQLWRVCWNDPRHKHDRHVSKNPDRPERGHRRRD